MSSVTTAPTARHCSASSIAHNPSRARHLEDNQALQGNQREPRPVKLTRFGGDEIGPDPDRLPAFAQRQHGERRSEPRRRSAIAGRGWPDLVQGALGKAAAERPVERRHTQAQPRLPASGGPGHHAP
jgi:hypothetical protein